MSGNADRRVSESALERDESTNTRRHRPRKRAIQ
jgi:hypothetical protein